MSTNLTTQNKDSFLGLSVLFGAIIFVVFMFFFIQNWHTTNLQSNIHDSFESKKLEVSSYEHIEGLLPGLQSIERVFSLGENLKSNPLYMKFYSLFKSDLALGSNQYYLVKTKDNKEYIAEVNRKVMVVQIHENAK